jgi:hypothetical protein
MTVISKNTLVSGPLDPPKPKKKPADPQDYLGKTVRWTSCGYSADQFPRYGHEGKVVAIIPRWDDGAAIARKVTGRDFDLRENRNRFSGQRSSKFTRLLVEETKLGRRGQPLKVMYLTPNFHAKTAAKVFTIVDANGNVAHGNTGAGFSDEPPVGAEGGMSRDYIAGPKEKTERAKKPRKKPEKWDDYYARRFIENFGPRESRSFSCYAYVQHDRPVNARTVSVVTLIEIEPPRGSWPKEDRHRPSDVTMTGRVFTGVSRLHPNDTFSRRTGRNRALESALKNMCFATKKPYVPPTNPS